jgi:hypothetical protein
MNSSCGLKSEGSLLKREGSLAASREKSMGDSGDGREQPM